MKKNVFSLIEIIALAAVLMAGLGGCNTLQSVEVSKEPARTVFGQGHEVDREVDWAGLLVTLHYRMKSIEASANDSFLWIRGPNMDQPGMQTVTVTSDHYYSNISGGVRISTAGMEKPRLATFAVTVVPVEQLSIQQPPAKTGYMQWVDDLDLTGLVVLAEFENGAVPGETISLNKLSFSEYDKSKAGSQSITVEYYGKQASFDVNVAALTSIVMTSLPYNTEYFTGEDPDLEGIAVMGTWEGVGEKPVTVTQENLSGFDKNRPGKQDVSVTYLGKTASARFPVTYVAMQGVSVVTPPEKRSYAYGEELNLSGLTVQGTRMGSITTEQVDISHLQISGYDSHKRGDQTVTITIGGKSSTFTVTVR
jgi:hypothetical protein